MKPMPLPGTWWERTATREDKSMHLSLRRWIRRGLIVCAAISVAAGESGRGARIIEVIADRDNTFKVPGQKKPVILAKPGEALDLRITSLKGEEAASDGAVHSF